jgi:uncharacterized protein
MIPADWLMGLIGGLMIGAAAAAYLLLNGRIMGASGILGGLIDGSGRDNRTERVFFIAALVLAPFALALWQGGADIHLSAPPLQIAIAGLLVGLGTRLANGCTSGHGVCGISRLSPRGMLATLIYVLAGGLTVAALRAAGLF